jgi:5S rRNA maturation endonuclease (ribonuclease M5)
LLPVVICAAVGLKLADLFVAKPKRNGHKKPIVATYDYTDESGAVLFQVVRFDPKDFRQRKPDGKGGWTWRTAGVRRVPFRLPELIAAVRAGRPVFVVEGEKDALAVIKAGFAATCNAGGAGKWSPGFSEYFKGAEVIVIADKDDAGREHAQEIAASLHGVAAIVRVTELPDLDGKPVKDAADFFAAGGQGADLDELAQAAPIWTPPPLVETPQVADSVRRAIGDLRPKILLPGNDRLLSDFASELAKELRDKETFWRNGEVVVLSDGDLKPMTPQTFRSWAEKFFIGYRAKTFRGNTYEFDATMTDNEARGTLASPQFIDALRRVHRVNRVRLPFFGDDGKLLLLPEGYHAPTETFTFLDVEFSSRKASCFTGSGCRLWS